MYNTAQHKFMTTIIVGSLFKNSVFPLIIGSWKTEFSLSLIVHHFLDGASRVVIQIGQLNSSQNNIKTCPLFWIALVGIPRIVISVAKI